MAYACELLWLQDLADLKEKTISRLPFSARVRGLVLTEIATPASSFRAGSLKGGRRWECSFFKHLLIDGKTGRLFW